MRTPGHILVVEDNPAIVTILTEMLAGEGYQVAASIGGRAVEAARDNPPDLVLLDVLMPEMDGPEVCRRLKADPRTRDVPVVFLTALPPVVLPQRLAGCQYEALIRKPFEVTEVLGTVERLLHA